MYGQSTIGKDSNTSHSATLIALSVSQICEHQLRSLRDELWRNTGDPSFLTLFPLLPLLWTPIGCRIPQALRFPALQLPITVQLDAYQYEEGLFLPVEDNGQLQAMREILNDWHRTIAEPPSGPPFPSLPFLVPAATTAIYLGTDSSAARHLVGRFGLKMSTKSFFIKDFRLVTIDMQSTRDWMRDLRYQVWQDRHLSLDGQDLSSAKSAGNT